MQLKILISWHVQQKVYRCCSNNWQRVNKYTLALNVTILTINIQLGIDGLDDLQIDPMKLSKIKIFAGEGPVSINSSLSKAVVTGFGNTVVIESEYVYDQFYLFIYYSFKNCLVESH